MRLVLLLKKSQEQKLLHHSLLPVPAEMRDSKLRLYWGELVDRIYFSDYQMHIDNFFIEDNVLVAKGYYTADEQKFLVIFDLNNMSDCIYYNINAAGINAYDNYIYVNYEENGKVYIGKIPLHDFTNEEATWSYEMLGMLHSYFYIIKDWRGPDRYTPKYIYQNDLEGKLHKYDLP